MSRQASIPEPSGSRTSITTRSGWKRRAASIASATVPGLGDDLELRPAVEQRDEALADDLVVVDDQQRQWPRSLPRSCVATPLLERRSLRPADGRGSSCPVGVAGDVHGRADGRHARAHVGEALVAERRRPSPGRTRGRCPRRRGPARPFGGCSTKTVARLAPEWRATLLSASLTTPRRCAGRGSGRAPSSTSPTCSSTSIIELWRNSSTSATRPLMSVVPLSSSGRRPKMKLRMSRIVRCRLSIARSTRRSTSSGSSADQLGHVLERQPDGVDALDDPVVEVLADALALVDDRRAAGPARGAGRSRSRCPHGRAKVSTSAWSSSENSSAPALFVRYRLPTERPLTVTGHAEEAVHRRVVRREPVAPRIDGDVRDPEGAVLPDDQAEEAVTAWQVARSLARVSRSMPRGDEALHARRRRRRSRAPRIARPTSGRTWSTMTWRTSSTDVQLRDRSGRGVERTDDPAGRGTAPGSRSPEFTVAECLAADRRSSGPVGPTERAAWPMARRRPIREPVAMEAAANPDGTTDPAGRRPVRFLAERRSTRRSGSRARGTGRPDRPERGRAAQPAPAGRAPTAGRPGARPPRVGRPGRSSAAREQPACRRPS